MENAIERILDAQCAPSTRPSACSTSYTAKTARGRESIPSSHAARSPALLRSPSFDVDSATTYSPKFSMKSPAIEATIGGENAPDAMPVASASRAAGASVSRNVLYAIS